MATAIPLAVAEGNGGLVMGTERDYDEVIAPMLAEVAKKCEELGMSIVARVEWKPDEAGITLKREEKIGVGQSMAEIAALSRGNVDSFCLEMVRRFDVSASIFLRSYYKPLTPPRSDHQPTYHKSAPQEGKV